MRTSAILALGALSAVQAFTPAPVIANNKAGTTYIATFTPVPGAQFAISGSVTGAASSSGSGTDFKVSLSGFDASKGPFAYHIHAAPVAASGNCSSTGAHLDPTNRGEMPVCDPSTPEMCQVGDLAGKYGKIKTDAFSASYHDAFTSTSPGSPAFFGDKSITIHLPDKSRIACANFKLVTGGVGTAPYPVSGGTGGFPMPTGTGAPFPSGTGAGSAPTGTAGSGNGSSGMPSGPSASSAVPGASGTGAPGSAGSSVPAGGASGMVAKGGVAAFAAAVVALML